ncbi:hypothetical protein [Methanobacterium aggregans]|uniref:hypothetical protein n=1 Tax=Methanobacterium aggregans TaxID=1615586 RepID=UPI001AE95A37|nr:hypothetical protein [Methanobacterium aggregans]MBP2045117.1 hypothetical protein [Methanobacterium aggregans]
MAKEIKQLVVGITREGDIIVKSARGRMYSVKKSADLKFSCEDLFQDVEKDLFATIDAEAQTWECTSIGLEQ